MSEAHKTENNAHLEHGDKRYNGEKGYSKADQGGKQDNFGEKIEKNHSKSSSSRSKSASKRK